VSPTREHAGDDGRPLRLVFALLHPGYLRHYAAPIRLLADRGHSVHVAFFRQAEGPTPPLLQALLEHPRVTAATAPRRRHLDGWRGVAWLVRALIDVLRYADPQFDDAPVLRARAAEKVLTRVGVSHDDPITRTVARRAVTFVASAPDPDRARRILRVLHAAERAIPSSRRIERLLRETDAVVVSPVVEIASPQVEIVKSAQRLRLPVAIAVASWDNLTSKGLLRVVPDRVFVWNEIQLRELAELHGVPGDRVVVTGGQKFDPWFDRRPSTTREEFARTAGLEPDRPYLLYLCSSGFIAPDEVSFVRGWLEALRSADDARVRDLGVLVRPHPQNATQWRDAELDDAVVWPRGGEFPDGGAAQAAFFDSIAHSAAVVGINTSAQIDAAIVGRPVFTVRAYGAQDETVHFHYLLRERGGFVRDATTLEEHLLQLADALDEPDALANELRRFVAAFVRPRGLERPVAPIVADEVEALAAAAPRRPRPALVLRLALYPLAAAMTLFAARDSVRYRYARSARRATTA
jgi:hypothetical protein